MSPMETREKRGMRKGTLLIALCALAGAAIIAGLLSWHYEGRLDAERLKTQQERQTKERIEGEVASLRTQRTQQSVREQQLTKEVDSLRHEQQELLRRLRTASVPLYRAPQVTVPEPRFQQPARTRMNCTTYTIGNYEYTNCY